MWICLRVILQFINQEIIAYVNFLDMDIIEHTLDVEMEAKNV
jgi:hypothetical protein